MTPSSPTGATSSTVEQLHLDLGEQSYPIFIGNHALAKADWLKQVQGDQIAIVTQPALSKAYLPALTALIQAAGYSEPLVIRLAEGEQAKSLDSANQVWSALLEAGFRRNATLIALGGGVVGDLTGFVAATYQRGMPFIQVPTTLLAQVDSSVGGKTAINHPLGKNMIGAFYQPKAVIADTASFKTLPKPEFAAGMAEVIKYGLIQDAGFFAWLKANALTLLQEFENLQSGADEEPSALRYIIKRCCEIKAQVVEDDEKELGSRAILNLGHTFGHAIEAHTHYQGVRHGEAVAIGMHMALDLSARMGQISSHVTADAVALLSVFDLPISPPKGMAPNDFLVHMRRDKKVQSSALRLVLLNALGSAYVTEDIPESKLQDCLDHFCDL